MALAAFACGCNNSQVTRPLLSGLLQAVRAKITHRLLQTFGKQMPFLSVVIKVAFPLCEAQCEMGLTLGHMYFLSYSHPVQLSFLLPGFPTYPFHQARSLVSCLYCQETLQHGTS